MIRSMARSGRGAMALVVAAMGARGPWKSLMRLMARLRRAAETKGSVGGAQLVAVLARDHVSDPVEAVLDGPMVPGPGGDGLGLGLVHGEGADQVDHLGGRRLLLGPAVPARAPALRGGCGASDPHHLGGAGEVDPLGGLDGLDGAPHPPAVAGVDARDGRDVLPGELLERFAQGLLVRLDRQEVVGAAAADPLGRVPLGVHGVGGDQDPAQVHGGEQVPQRGDLVGLVRHSALPHDHSARPARGRQEVGGRVVTGAGPAHGLAVHGDHPAAADGAHARAQPGRHPRVEVVGVHPLEHSADGGLTGQGPPLLQVQGPRSAGSRSATCSRIAPSVRHPARTPTTARHPAAVRQWRTPRLSRGSSTPFRTSLSGWRDRAVVVDDDMAARPPGGEVDSSTTQRPGGAAPHPRQHADNPGHQTTSRRLCRDPAPPTSHSWGRPTCEAPSLFRRHPR